MSHRVWLIVLSAFPIVCDGCSSCRGGKDGDRVAELVGQQNTVQRDFSSRIGQWQNAKRGDVFRIGDGVKTGKAAFAKLRIMPDGEMLVQSETLVRFQANAPGQQARRIQVETGSVEIDSARSELQIRTDVGLARIERGSRLQVRASAKEAELRVLVGSIEIDQQGKPLAVSAGHALSLDVGGVVIDKEESKTVAVSKTAGAAGKAEGAGGEVDAGLGEPQQPAEAEETGETLEAGRGPADLTIGAGESATIHDPNPPTRVRIPIAGCENGGVVEVGRAAGGYKYASIRGGKSAVVRLPTGRYRYRVRCTKSGKENTRVISKGSMLIQRDAGMRQLPKKPPDISIEADGRNYTVRYQNLLPKLTFVWPDAPDSKVYTINVNSNRGGSRSERSAQPRYVFNSGQLGEGSHQFYFAVPTGRRSSTGNLTVVFDNSARTASLSEPPENAAAAPSGQKVTVSGTALTNSRVSIGGAPVATDAQGRFKTEVAPLGNDAAVAVRVQHGAAKIHYYLRHLAANQR